MQNEQILVIGRFIDLQAGMQVGVDVKTGEQRIIELLLAPVLKGLDEGIQRTMKKLESKPTKWPFAIVLMLVIAYSIYAGPSKVRKLIADAKVEKLCFEDGGVQIFEHVILSQEEYDKNGGLRDFIDISPEIYTKESDEYFVNRTTEEIFSKSNLKIFKSVYTTYRKADRKIMSIYTSYSRRGGDAPSFAHPSSFGCGSISALKPRYTKRFYTLSKGIIKNERKN